jgi:hypothetical protein
MAIYEGVLEKMSGGVNNTGGRWTVREFIEIGDTHLRNVALTNYTDELLKEAVGQQVSVSIAGGRGRGSGRKSVFALRTPRRGIVKAIGLPALTVQMIVRTLAQWFAGILVILPVWWLLGTVLDLHGNSNLVSLFGLAAIFFLWPLLNATRIFRAWAAL